VRLLNVLENTKNSHKDVYHRAQDGAE